MREGGGLLDSTMPRERPRWPSAARLIDMHPHISERLAVLMVKFDEDLEKTSRPAGEA